MEVKVFLCLVWVMILLGKLHGYKSCIEKERKAFLDIKKSIISLGNPDFDLTTWTNDTQSDCCLWKGVECSRTSGRVIKISFGDFYFTKNSILNLSLLHPFEEVQSLDFRYSWFSGLFDDVEGYNSLRRLRHLEILDLSSNLFNNSIFPFLNAATSLTTLFLRSNNMDGPFPVKELKDLTNLELLDLSENRFNGSIYVKELSALTKLKALDLSDNKFSGSMDLQGICKLKNIQELDLSKNKLVGRFPLCLTSLIGLRVLDLSSNRLTGNISSGIGSLESLEYLSLIDNGFKGIFSFGILTNLSRLRVVKFGSTFSSFQVESDDSWEAKFQLEVIVLRSCNLEKVPHFLLRQKDLRQVDLSDNNISGTFPSWMLVNNTKLEVLRLQSNSLTSFQLPKSAHNLVYLNVSVNKFNHLFPERFGWIFPHLRSMNLANNGFQGNLPHSFGNMRMIEFMDISHNSFHGKLPTSFLKGCYSLMFLKLSHNKLSGEIFQESANFTRIEVLFMDNNQFTGNIGENLRSLRYLEWLDISNNNLTGVIPSWIGELSFLLVLQLSYNSLEGEIPVSLFTSLGLLDLSANNLSGNIPPRIRSTNSIALFLQGNNLSGAIPDTLLVDVSVLDLRNNRLSGNIPKFSNSQDIKVLLLRGNNLTGHIPRQLCALRKIHLLDLSNNSLNGSIPSCISNISFGLGKEDIPYDFRIYFGLREDVTIPFKSLLFLDQLRVDYEAATLAKIEFAAKYRYDAYMGGSLEFLFGLDLSKNMLSGEIPMELGGLLELKSLNLSHNNLARVIPESFSGLKNVESLDLSFNNLQGPIPPQLTELSSLAVFLVSFNNLSGAIPQGRQFDTFDEKSYLGNPLLCGKPTNRSCEGNNFQESDNEVEADESPIDMVSFYWSFAASYVTILLGVVASLSFDSPWSRGWFYIVDAFIYKVRNLCW